MHKQIAAFAAVLALACPALATVTTASNTVTYVGNGSTTAFAVPFKFLATTDLVVTVAGATQTLTTNYTVKGAGNATGTVTFTTAPANLASVIITRNVQYTQGSSLRQALPFPVGTTIENALDKLTMGEQQLQALYTNPPATVLPANVTAKLNGIRFADQFANIQAAITDAGTTGSVIIPSGYAGTDGFANPNGIPILDLRGGPAAVRGFISVKDFGAKGDGIADDTSAIQAAIATGRAVYFPAPVVAYKITSGITGIGAWRGDGQGNAFDSNSGPGVTIIRCVGTNGGAPFITPPHDMEGIHFDGVNLSATGLAISADNGTFVAFLRWRNITIRNFSIGIHGYNWFSSILENVVIQNNHEGIRIDPTVTTPDGGYFTSTDWRNVYIADNDVEGLYVSSPQLTKTWTWTDIVIERNGAAGSYQAFLQNVMLSANGLYIEGTPTKPGLQTNNVNILITNGYINGTGGINATSNTFRAYFSRVLMVTATDTITGLSALSYMVVRDGSTLQTDVRSIIGGRADVQFSNIGANFITRQRTEYMTSPTYGASITVDAKLGNIFQITPTDAVAFTVSAPLNGAQGQRITIRIRNTTAGAIGAATWNANYKLGGAWVQPAAGFSRSIEFISYDGTFYIETSRTAADVPN